MTTYDIELRSAVMGVITDVWDRVKQIDDAADEVLDLIEADRKRMGNAVGEFEPVAWKWRFTPVSQWVCVGHWDSIEAKAASEMGSWGWEVVRLYASPQSAELDKLRAEVERLRSMTAVTIGVGSGDGNLFVHGDYDSIKAVQSLVFRAEGKEE